MHGFCLCGNNGHGKNFPTASQVYPPQSSGSRSPIMPDTESE
ncbi:hypothetical protein [Neisseria sp.]